MAKDLQSRVAELVRDGKEKANEFIEENDLGDKAQAAYGAARYAGDKIAEKVVETAQSSIPGYNPEVGRTARRTAAKWGLIGLGAGVAGAFMPIIPAAIALPVWAYGLYDTAKQSLKKVY